MNKIEIMNKLLNILDEFGTYPSELYIFNELNWMDDFQDLSDEEQNIVFNRCYKAYIDDDIDMTVVCAIAYNHLTEILNNDKFDFIAYL